MARRQIALFGVPIRVHPSFFLVLLLLGVPAGLAPDELLRTAIWVAVVTVSILWHELGHALAMRLAGFSPRIELYSLGGLTAWGSGPTPSRRVRVLVSLAGPGAGFLLGAVGLFGSHWIPPVPGSIWGTTSSYLLWVNLAWGLFNLMPMLPLDGGEVLASLLEARWSERGRQAARWISLVTASALALYALASNWLWLVFLAAWAGAQTFRQAREHSQQAKDEPLWAELDELWRSQREGELEPLLERAERLWDRARSASLKAAVAEQLAWALLRAGRAAEARGALRAKSGEIAPSPLVEGAVALDLGELAEARSLIEEAHEGEPTATTLHYLVEVLVRLERLDEALAALELFAPAGDGAAPLALTLETLGRALSASGRTSSDRHG
jgi:stage IV sporulation protein FB